MLADRTIARSGVTPPNSLLRWAQTTPGAGHAARRLYRELVSPQEREQRAAWAREVFERSDGVPFWPNAQFDGPVVINPEDAKYVLAHPHLIRSLVALRSDTSWLSELLYKAVTTRNVAAIKMLVSDDPARAPPSRDALFDATRFGFFEEALILLDHGYGPTLKSYKRGMVAVLFAVEREMDGQPTFPDADLALVPSVIARIARTWPTGGDYGSNELERIGREIATRMQPDQFAELRANELRPIVSGVLLKLINRLSLNPTDDAAIAQAQLWMLADLRGAARAAVLSVRRDHWMLVFSLGLADLLYDDGRVEITPTDVIFHEDANGLDAAVSRAVPEVDTWAATKQVDE